MILRICWSAGAASADEPELPAPAQADAISTAQKPSANERTGLFGWNPLIILYLSAARCLLMAHSAGVTTLTDDCAPGPADHACTLHNLDRCSWHRWGVGIDRSPVDDLTFVGRAADRPIYRRPLARADVSKAILSGGICGTGRG